MFKFKFLFAPTDQPDNIAAQLIEDGRAIARLKDKDPLDVIYVSRMSPQRRALAVSVLWAANHYPAIMFRAMFEGWSVLKIATEIQKLIVQDKIGSSFS